MLSLKKVTSNSTKGLSGLGKNVDLNVISLFPVDG